MNKYIILIFAIALSISTVYAQSEKNVFSIGGSYSYLQFYEGGDVLSMMVWANSRIGANVELDIFARNNISLGLNAGILSNLWAIVEFPVMAYVSYDISEVISMGLAGGYILGMIIQPDLFENMHFIVISINAKIKRFRIELGDAVFLNNLKASTIMQNQHFRFLLGYMIPINKLPRKNY